MKWEIDYSSIEELEKKVSQLPNQTEVVINSYLHKKGVDITKSNITQHMNVSKKVKKHAKYSSWSRKKTENLGFEILAKGGAANRPGSFGYLVFPNEGRGPRNPAEQRFMEKGLHESTAHIIDDLLEQVITKIQEELQ
jgi:hypothetical protein